MKGAELVLTTSGVTPNRVVDLIGFLAKEGPVTSSS